MLPRRFKGGGGDPASVEWNDEEGQTPQTCTAQEISAIIITDIITRDYSQRKETELLFKRYGLDGVANTKYGAVLFRIY